MSFVLVMLVVVASAVCATIALTMATRLAADLAARRVARYLDTVQDHVMAYVVEARDDPPPPPRGRFHQRVMRQRLVALAPSVKGDARARLGELFRSYGLVEVARADLDSRDALTRVRAAEALAAMGARESVSWLRARLEHPDPLLELACARALAELGVTDALPDVMAALARSGAEQGEVTDVLLVFGAGGVPFLRARLRDAPVAQRRLAAAALGEIRALEAAPDLRALLDEDDDELVARAVRALGQVGDAAAVPRITALLSTPERAWFVRVAAASALGALDDPAAAPALATVLGDEHWDVRNAASRALVALGEAGVDAVTTALDDIPDRGIAHFAGVLDVDGDLQPLIARAAAGDAQLDRLVHRAAAARVRARLEELAGGDGHDGTYAARVLAGSAA